MIVDNVAETLVTMDAADDDESAQYVANISVPVGLITLETGRKIETAGACLFLFKTPTDLSLNSAGVSFTTS